MSMITEIAVANLKYHKSKNILTGIAIFLTTLLLFLVPTIGMDLINCQKAAINEEYPTWHALFRNVSEDTAKKLSSHHMLECFGLRNDLGYIAVDDANIAMMYMDAQAVEMYKLKLSEGRLPEAENEIVLSRGILEELSLSGEIGDTVTISYQVYRNGSSDFIQKKDFVICGFLPDTEESKEQKSYTTLVSKAFLKEEIPSNEIVYRFLFQIDTEYANDTEKIEESIQQLAEQFGISEQDYRINEDYLWANYVDPSFIPIMLLIMLIIVVAGIITIYSIYYISMEERVQEFGKIKAIGATTGQLRRSVLLEGFLVAGIAVPLGLLAGTLLTKYVFLSIFKLYQNENMLMSTIQGLIHRGEVQLLIPWIYLLAAGVAMLTVFLSLLRPMKIAAKVSEIEAMRYTEEQTTKKSRKGYSNITVTRLAMIHLAGNKKKSLITICSMAITGLFFMVVVTVLSCADPSEAADNSVMGEYQISPIIEFNNKEHPELEWSQVQKDNPLTEELKEQILQIDGVNSVECYLGNYVEADAFDGDREGIIEVPESGKELLENGIIEGNATYEELKSGDKVIIDKNLLYWYPDLKIGDVLEVVFRDGDEECKKQLEIAAIGDYSLGFISFHYLIMAEEGLHSFSNHNLNMYYRIFADKKYDADVEAKLKALVEENGRIEMDTWKAHYDEWNSAMTLTRGACYAFLGILGAICIMNMINTMIHSVHIRKKEIGMLQAVGMSDLQLLKMLQFEGLFYTAGTLLVAVGGGSVVGYPVFYGQRIMECLISEIIIIL
ncbi:MAG: FtsX-like permease family protein [Lachnospiraceae bacterium]|nr:FtsX-like permease family protein [Lachnospiraceae bacterium]